MENAMEMLISNDAGFANSQWQPYREDVDWEIWSEYGYVKVYVLFRNPYGTSDTYSDGIFYQTTISTQRRQYVEWLAIAEGRANLDGTPTQKGIYNESFASSPEALPVGINPGDLLKVPGNSTIYYIGVDHKRHAIPTQKEYDSWFQSFNAVKEVPATYLYKVQLGKTMTVRPGTYLVKIKTDPKVYMVDEAGRLRWITSETIAGALFGHGWKTRIVDLDVTQFADYELGPSLVDFKYVDGIIVRKGDEVYKVYNNEFVKMTGDGYLYNDYQDRFVVRYNQNLNLPVSYDTVISGWIPQSLPKNTLYKQATK